MNHQQRFTRLFSAVLAALLIALAGTGAATAQSTESFVATHFSVPEGQNELPPIEGDAGYSVAIMRLDPMTSSLEYRVSVALPAGQTILVAHFHRGARGENGPPVHALTFASGSMTATGTWSNISPADMAALMTQGIYLNIHTNANETGQLRDQVNLIPNLTATEMSPLWETPPIPDLAGTGNAFIYLDQTAKRAIYVVDWDSLTGPPTMAHFHRGVVGESGPPIHPIPIPSGAGIKGTTFGTWENISEADINDLKNGGVYVNIHTNMHGTGEIRAQVVGTEFYTAAISPANEVPPVTSSNGMGTGFVSLFGKRTLYGVFIVDGLTGPASMAHIHQQVKGENGSIRFNLFSLAILGYPGVWFSLSDTLSGDDYMNFRNSAMYANFHTEAHGTGEVRGQLIPSASILDAGTVSVRRQRQTDVPALASWYDRSSGTIHLRATDPGTLRDATVELYSSLGARIATIPVPEGENAVRAGSIPAGVYFVQLLKDGVPAGMGRVAVVR